MIASQKSQCPARNTSLSWTTTPWHHSTCQSQQHMELNLALQKSNSSHKVSLQVLCSVCVCVSVCCLSVPCLYCQHCFQVLHHRCSLVWSVITLCAVNIMLLLFVSFIIFLFFLKCNCRCLLIWNLSWAVCRSLCSCTWLSWWVACTCQLDFLLIKSLLIVLSTWQT